MAQAVPLGADVAAVYVVGRGLDRLPVDDFQAVARQPQHLAGVVGQQPQFGNAQVQQHLRPGLIVALVALEPQRPVGVHRVQPLVLQRIGFDFVVQADAAPLLPHIQQHPGALVGDGFQRQVNLLAAVAAQTAEHIPGQTFAVDAHQRRLFGRLIAQIAHNQGDVFALVEVAAVAHGAEFAVAGGQLGFGHPFDHRFVAAAVRHQLGDAEDFEAVFFGQLFQTGHQRHRPVFVHNFADDAGRVHSGQVAQIDDGLGVAGPGQHAAGIVAQREQMPRPGEFAGLRRRVDHRLDGGGPVESRYAGGGAFVVVHRNGEGRLVFAVGVFANHQRHRQLVQPLPDDRHTEQPPGVLHDEVDGLRGDFLGGHHQVAFVFPPLIVHHDEELAGFQLGQGLFHTAQRHRLPRSAPVAPAAAVNAVPGFPHTWPGCRLPG